MATDPTDADGDGIVGERAPFTIAADNRLHDDPGIPGTTIGDMGAHEFIGASCPGDLNTDGVVNTADMTLLLVRFGQGVPVYTLGDFTGDAVVNTTDLTMLLLKFGTPCPT